MQPLRDIQEARRLLSSAAKAIADRAEGEGRTLLNPGEEADLERIFGAYCKLLEDEKAARRSGAPSRPRRGLKAALGW